ncbi:MAG: hypothetical protein ACREDX_02175 [Aestuariivirga sp.]
MLLAGIIAGGIAGGIDREPFRLLRNFLGPHTILSADMTSNPLAASRARRSDNEMLSAKLQLPHKGGLTMTRISLSGISVVNKSGFMESDIENNEMADANTEPVEVTMEQVTAEQVTTEQVLGLKIAPILRKNKNTGQLEIGNFKPMSLVGDTDECLNIGYSMLSDTGSSNDHLDVLTASDQITVAKICANNGSIVISCRSDQITVSPRHSRPDDKCQRTGKASLARHGRIESIRAEMFS